MNRVFTGLTFIIFLFLGFGVHAASVVGKVKLLSHEVTGTYVQLVDDQDAVITTNPGSCASNQMYHLSLEHTNYAVLSNSLLTAQTLQQPITFELDGCANDMNKVAFVRFGDWSGVNISSPTSLPPNAPQANESVNLLELPGNGFQHIHHGSLYGNVPNQWDKRIDVQGRGYINYLHNNNGSIRGIRVVVDGVTVIDTWQTGDGDIINEHSTDITVLKKLYFSESLEVLTYTHAPVYHSYYLAYNLVKMSD